ncbi:DMT family transporter [Elizabethkingia meningoseptica]|uniref:DMT family transporter n=1 Tax=Elizabethkingia meningoseptica TaxID=238 RepID=UPI0023AF68F5|nr:DMT family transporter [Elizabethkingia meningoseptica]MDE5468938.1 DMT family transporter [Elizabethkingia meningoseptica]MDE5476252.1 DMT family transporter [Elizabethkingia meningoseptica]MDE5479186.1 DMT family transporter [Elizabethkingia meningoseptica]MDE5485134.1 DMT family transporter [Elizabethkingia meningoseptica]MDE5502588.1 DMT family transporter [Elizabethkingia meningoseptica]
MFKSAQFRLHLIVFLWGFTAILGKLITVDALELVFFRMLFAAIFLYIFIRVVKKQSMKVSRKLFLQLIGIGGLMGGHWLCFFYSIKISNVSIALSCLATVTLFVSVLEPIVYRRKLDWVELLLGLVIVSCISLIFNVEFEHKMGIIFGIICAALGATFTVFNGKLYGKTSSENIIFYEIFGGWILVSLFLLASGDITSVAAIDTKNIILLIVLAGFFTAYPMLESVRLMQYISPFTLALTVNLEPVYGIVLAYFIFGKSEEMSPVFYGASAVMILAIVVNGIVKARRKKLPAVH